jgi:heme-degrading monooxygenase HmoA
MSAEIGRDHVPDGDEARFEAAYSEAQRYLAESPVCRAYELLSCEEEPARYLLRIEWTSTADHLGMPHHARTSIAGQGAAVPAA